MLDLVKHTFQPFLHECVAGLLERLLQVALDELSLLPTHLLFLLFLCDAIQIVQVGLGQSRDACADFLLDLTECVGRIDL